MNEVFTGTWKSTDIEYKYPTTEDLNIEVKVEEDLRSGYIFGRKVIKVSLRIVRRD